MQTGHPSSPAEAPDPGPEMLVRDPSRQQKRRHHVVLIVSYNAGSPSRFTVTACKIPDQTLRYSKLPSLSDEGVWHPTV